MTTSDASIAAAPVTSASQPETPKTSADCAIGMQGILRASGRRLRCDF